MTSSIVPTGKEGREEKVKGWKERKSAVAFLSTVIASKLCTAGGV